MIKQTKNEPWLEGCWIGVQFGLLGGGDTFTDAKGEYIKLATYGDAHGTISSCKRVNAVNKADGRFAFFKDTAIVFDPREAALNG